MAKFQATQKYEIPVDFFIQHRQNRVFFQTESLQISLSNDYG